MLIPGGRKFKSIIKDVTNTAWVMSLRPLNKKSLLTTAFRTPQAKVVRDGGNGLPRAEVTGLGDDAAVQLEMEPPPSHWGQAKPFPSAARYVPLSNEENPFPGLMYLLGELLDGDTLAGLVSIMAEPNETAALLEIGAMQGRIERRMLREGSTNEDATAHALQVAEGVCDAWTTLHQPKWRNDRTLLR